MNLISSSCLTTENNGWNWGIPSGLWDNRLGKNTGFTCSLTPQTQPLSRTEPFKCLDCLLRVRTVQATQAEPIF